MDMKDQTEFHEAMWRVFEEKYRGASHRHPEWPKTLEEAVNTIIDSLTDTDKKLLLSKSAKDLSVFHQFWGMEIRNRFGLWNGNIELLKLCGYMDGDRASMVIITVVWKTLRKMNGLPDEFEEEDIPLTHRLSPDIAALHHLDEALRHTKEIDK